MSIMSVQIQCKSSLNQGLTDKLKGKNPMEGEGGKNGPAQSFPTPYLEESFGWMLVTWISPWDMSIMSVQIQCKSSLNRGLTDKLKG